MTTAYEIKFRRKGEVKIWKDFYGDDLPEVIKKAIPGGLLGIDLTGYPVISISARRSCVEQAHATLAENKGVCVVYMYSWANGFGQGVLIPENFDPRRLRFYQTEGQKEEEDIAYREKEVEDLIAEIKKRFPNLKATSSFDKQYAVVSPDQEVFADWGVWVKKIEEVEEKIKGMVSLWGEWNARGVETYTRRTGNVPGKGWVHVYKSPSDSNRKMVGLQLSCDITKPSWVWFEKNKQGEWVELEELKYGPPTGV